MREIKVSVIVCAYNIETFIAPCLESILSQKTDFDFEILVGDDGSTDSTRDVISAFKDAHPEKIIPVFREKNLGTSRNFIDLVYQAKGEFIAQVDGDDYLIDHNKLSLQVQFLQSHANCSICFHDHLRVDQFGNSIKESVPPFESDTVVGVEFLLHSNLGPGNTTLFRKSSLPTTPPEWLLHCGNHKDFAIQFLVALKGDIGYIRKTMSAYTWHDSNITKTEKKETLYINSLIINQGLLDYQKKLGIQELKTLLNGSSTAVE